MMRFTAKSVFVMAACATIAALAPIGSAPSGRRPTFRMPKMGRHRRGHALLRLLPT